MIDYERLKRSMPKLKAVLTRAKNKGPDAVIEACDEAINALFQEDSDG